MACVGDDLEAAPPDPGGDGLREWQRGLVVVITSHHHGERRRLHPSRACRIVWRDRTGPESRNAWCRHYGCRRPSSNLVSSPPAAGTPNNAPAADSGRTGRVAAGCVFWVEAATAGQHGRRGPREQQCRQRHARIQDGPRRCRQRRYRCAAGIRMGRRIRGCHPAGGRAGGAVAAYDMKVAAYDMKEE